MVTLRPAFYKHARSVSVCHLVAFPILALNVFWIIYRAVVVFSVEVVVASLLGVRCSPCRVLLGSSPSPHTIA